MSWKHKVYIVSLIFLLRIQTLHLNDKYNPLTSVTIDEYFLLPRHMCMVILVTDGHRQGAGQRLGRVAAVTHYNRNEELFLALAVKRP